MSASATIVFAEHVKSAVDQQTRSIMVVVEQQTGHLESMLHQMPQHFSLAPTSNIRALHNRYVKAILASTAAKHVSLSLSLIESVNKADFLTYAMAARSAVEAVATLRYLLLGKMGPVIHTMAQSGMYDASQVNELIKYEDTYLRGTRFDWVKFFEYGFRPLNERYAEWLKEKKKNKGAKKWTPASSGVEQFSVCSCLEKWAAQEPGVGVLYDLLCDMVHPNIGSVMSTMVRDGEGLRFAVRDSSSEGFELFKLSFPALVTLAWRELTRLFQILPGLALPEEEKAPAPHSST